ncbi:DUF2489 domain-containing protein [Thalassotalea mangrovi]|uniref:DUF2489 domain-containing protein n=1 Tax=Thalassotalea mangrovi TaxID=2572245 RepID=A0A4U1B9Q4_9GAMM|nr:DUF2489 domain-containing protein [Thalassotalea mangrovi]TKB46825.1 DUF2489 domain-containing protein [Thalassotalea mangrovi]
MSNLTISLLVLAAAIIFALTVYASMLLFKLRHQTKMQKALTLEQQQKRAEKDLKVVSSLLIICKAMQEKQCDLSEGCWRLSVLIESMEYSLDSPNERFPAIFSLYNKISHMPILEERKKLSKKDKLKLDLERMGYEEELEAEIFADIERLIPDAQYHQQTLRDLTLSK